MTDHPGLPVAGYTAQSDEKVDIVNRAKELEERVLRHIDFLKNETTADPRMVAEAMTHIQAGFMWANRAVFQPARIKLPEDNK